MTTVRSAFIGDVHGEPRMLEDLLAQLPLEQLERVVFLGDYVNRGSNSAAVLNLLLQLTSDSKYVFLQGNHDRVFLEAVDTGDLGRFLRMGGARTVLSYLSYPVGSDVSAQLQSAVPEAHVGFLRMLIDRYEDEEVVATHDIRLAPRDGRFRFAGHIPVGTIPHFEEEAALIDTGCGTVGGRLSAVLWPSLSYLQALPTSINF